MIRVILFDIDGTLIQSGGAGRAALDVAFEQSFGMPRREPVEVEGRTDRGIARQLLTSHGMDDNDENRLRLLSNYLEALPERMRMARGRVLPGVRALLDRLAEVADIDVGLLTGNTGDGARIKLEHFRLEHHFEFGGFGDRSADRNLVAAEALASARERWGEQLSPDRICVVGDTALDVRCARSIGARVAAVCTGGGSREELAIEKPDLLLDDLSEDGWWQSVFE